MRAPIKMFCQELSLIHRWNKDDYVYHIIFLVLQKNLVSLDLSYDSHFSPLVLDSWLSHFHECSIFYYLFTQIFRHIYLEHITYHTLGHALRTQKWAKPETCFQGIRTNRQNGESRQRRSEVVIMVWMELCGKCLKMPGRLPNHAN